MMEDRILVYKNTSQYENLINKYQFVFRLFNELVVGLKLCNLKPTKEMIQELINGGSVRNMMATKEVETSFPSLPKGMKKILQEMFIKETDEDYLNLIESKAAKLTKIKQASDNLVDFSHFTLEKGMVILSPDHIKYAEKLYCVFIDSPGKRQVYDAWQSFLAAKKNLDEVVTAATKRQPNALEKASGQSGDYLIGISAPGNFSVGKIRYDGEAVLNGENFDWFK